MKKLYVAMVGLPASGKSTLARRLCEDLNGEGISTAIFNNGDMRRKFVGSYSTHPDFYSPDNEEGRLLREKIALANMQAMREYLAGDGKVAILDATNASYRRRRLIEKTLDDYPVLFIEALNDDPILRDACIQHKTTLPEYSGYTEEEAIRSFKSRISFYEAKYTHVKDCKYWLQVDTMANRVIGESPLETSPYYPAIRELVSSTWVKNLYLARHGQTLYNIDGRVGGDPVLSDKGKKQAQALAAALKGVPLERVFISSRQRSNETASYVLAEHPDVPVRVMPEFDEISSGLCENLTYDEIRQEMPEVTHERNADKYGYCYPGGESYAMLRERVMRGLNRVLFLAGSRTILIVGHQAINRAILSIFLRRRTEDIPYLFVPQNQYYHIVNTPRCTLVERIPY